MRFRIGETIYHGTTLDQLSLVDILLLEKGTQDLGVPLKWAEVQVWTEELEHLVQVAADETRPKRDRDAAIKAHNEHPGVLWVMALVIWAARRLAGEAITFEAAVSFPMTDLEWLPEENRAARRAANPTKARPTPKGSGRAARPQPAPRTKTSKPASTPA